MSWGALLDERTIVRGYVSVVGVFLQHVDLQFNLLLFVLQETKNTRTQRITTGREQIPIALEGRKSNSTR